MSERNRRRKRRQRKERPLDEFMIQRYNDGDMSGEMRLLRQIARHAQGLALAAEQLARHRESDSQRGSGPSRVPHPPAHAQGTEPSRDG